MHALYRYLVIPLLYLLSLLPFRVLYLLSDLLYLLFYRWGEYRKEIVMNNLRNAFPGEPEEVIRDICDRFYHFFFDLTLETLKLLTISRKSLRRRVQFVGGHVFRHFQEKGRSTIAVMGHFGNWELAGARFSLDDLPALYAIYHPLRNHHFDQLLYHMRSRFGTRLIPMKETLRTMLENRPGLTVTAFIADQTPSHTQVYWTSFLNQDTAVFSGPEKIARKLDYPVIYIATHRLKRGLYRIEAELLVAHPRLTKDGEITEIHTRRLERDIRAHPELWLWSHRRWKHKRPDGTGQR